MTDNKKLIELETKSAFQENLLSELNQVVIQQQADIDQLRKRCGHLEKELQQLKNADTSPIDDQPPPHY